jgi:fusion and transport protein UGO1
MINQELSPVTFSVAKFCSSSVALFIKLPLETVLRRGQVSILGSPAYVRALETANTSSAAAKGKRLGGEVLETIVPPGRFDGVFGTMQAIVSQEGSRAVSPGAKGAAANAKKAKPRISETVYRRGQGLEGLWRGWKVSWWGLVGLWTAGVLAGGGDGEF